MTETAFNATVAKAPEAIRDAVEDMAWGNAWSAETYYDYDTDARRWEIAIATAEAIIDAPADYGLTA